MACVGGAAEACCNCELFDIGEMLEEGVASEEDWKEEDAADCPGID